METQRVSSTSRRTTHGQTSTSNNTTAVNNSTLWSCRPAQQGWGHPRAAPAVALGSLLCRAMSWAVTQPQDTSFTGWLPLGVWNLSPCVRKAWSAKPGICQKTLNYVSLLLMLKPHEDFFGRKMKRCKAFSSKAFKALELFNWETGYFTTDAVSTLIYWAMRGRVRLSKCSFKKMHWKET